MTKRMPKRCELRVVHALLANAEPTGARMAWLSESRYQSAADRSSEASEWPTLCVCEISAPGRLRMRRCGSAVAAYRCSAGASVERNTLAF